MITIIQAIVVTILLVVFCVVCTVSLDRVIYKLTGWSLLFTVVEQYEDIV